MSRDVIFHENVFPYESVNIDNNDSEKLWHLNHNYYEDDTSSLGHGLDEHD